MGQADDSVEWDEIEAATPKIQEKALEHAIRSVNEAEALGGTLLLKFNQEKQKAELLLKQPQLLDRLNGEPVQPELGAFTVGTNPNYRYGSTFEDLLDAETDMRNRCMKIQNQLEDDEAALTLTTLTTLTAFPRLGAEIEEKSVRGDLPQSSILSDTIVSDESRYPTVNKNIVARRKRPFQVSVPIYQDKYTKCTQLHGDSLAFGHICCGLQLTFQAEDLQQARKLHYQLIPFGPILMALEAATPSFRGHLTDTGSRWNQSSLTVDDRRDDEHKSQT